MRYIAIVIVFICVCLSAFGQQKFKYGVTGGVGMSFMQTYDGFVPYYSNDHSIFSYYLGAIGEYRFL
jgi:hypothetical protein